MAEPAEMDCHHSDPGSPVSTKELCQYIADATTASKGDVYNVLMSLPKIIELFMKNGRSVKLEGIGTLLAA